MIICTKDIDMGNFSEKALEKIEGSDIPSVETLDRSIKGEINNQDLIEEGTAAYGVAKVLIHSGVDFGRLSKEQQQVYDRYIYPVVNPKCELCDDIVKASELDEIFGDIKCMNCQQNEYLCDRAINKDD